MTAVLHDLRENLTLTREVYGRGSSQAQEAFELLVRTADANGTPIDGLRHHVADEVERFFSFTIPGLDGHVYWDGPKHFRRNDGKYRTPVRWWWQHRYANLVNHDDLVVKCGEKNCINPEHFAKEYLRGFRMRWTRDRMIGRLQVVALQLGHTPTTTEWEHGGNHPGVAAFAHAFGSWAEACTSAGLAEPVRRTSGVTKTAAIAGIRFVHRLLGKWPSHQDYESCRDELRAAALPTTTRPATRLYGAFAAARVAAGGPESLRSDGQSRRTDVRNGNPTSAEDCLRAICFVRDRIGRWPTKLEFEGERDALLAAGLPTSETPMRRLFGSFVAGRVAAGGPASLDAEIHLRPARAPHANRATAEACLDGIRFVHERLGRWPNRTEYEAGSVALRVAGFPGSAAPAIKAFGSFTAARKAAGGPSLLPGGRRPRSTAGPAESESSGVTRKDQ